MVLAFAEPSKATCKQNCKLKSDWFCRRTGKKEEITCMTPILFQAAAVANGCKPGKHVMFGSILASQRIGAPSTLFVRLALCKAVLPSWCESASVSVGRCPVACVNIFATLLCQHFMSTSKQAGFVEILCEHLMLASKMTWQIKRTSLSIFFVTITCQHPYDCWHRSPRPRGPTKKGTSHVITKFCPTK